AHEDLLMWLFNMIDMSKVNRRTPPAVSDVESGARRIVMRQFYVIVGAGLVDVVDRRGAASRRPYKILKIGKVGGAGGFDYVYADDADGRQQQADQPDRCRHRRPHTQLRGHGPAHQLLLERL